eukprot:1144044-Pelagomonas_calceolata.AAC.3
MWALAEHLRCEPDEVCPAACVVGTLQESLQALDRSEEFLMRRALPHAEVCRPSIGSGHVGNRHLQASNHSQFKWGNKPQNHEEQPPTARPSQLCCCSASAQDCLKARELSMLR